VARAGETCVAAHDFFLRGFNLILWTKRLILEEHGVKFSGFLTGTLAALLVGKAVLVGSDVIIEERERRPAR
jgi:hypothetical protein